MSDAEHDKLPAEKIPGAEDVLKITANPTQGL
jgi:hypothetical protein